MNMKQHIFAALEEEFNQWEVLLESLSEEQILTPLQPSPWSTKDDMAHLMAWQQRSIARVEGAVHNREPEFPKWPFEADPDGEGSPDAINAWIYETYRNLPWPTVHQNWREGFQRFYILTEQISERDLLDSGKYAWLNGSPLAIVLLATYDHHQEHYEKLLSWLRGYGILK